MKRQSVFFSLSVLAVSGGVAACGGSSFSAQTANVAGAYSVALTSGDNGCQFASWTPGSSVQDVPVTITQQNSSVTATVAGSAALVLDLVLGTATFQGTVTGDSFTMSAFGKNPGHDGNCTFTIEATLSGSITGDAIQGTIAYTEKTNGDPACAYHSTCSSAQSFAGSRPPHG
jgi:hypothetical protein